MPVENQQTRGNAVPSAAEVKHELVRTVITPNGERLAELATILRLSGGLHNISGKIALEAELHTPQIVQRVRKALAELFGIQSDAQHLSGASARPGTPQFLVRVAQGETLVRQLGLVDPRRRPIRGLPNRLTTGNPRELEAMWRGAFLARGLFVAPARTVSLEVDTPTNEVAMALVGAAGRLGIEAKNREIRGQDKVIIRDDVAIGAMLRAMGAPVAADQWETVRKEKETRATANRLVNFDDANLRRSAQASVAACARVERALEILGDETPEHLRYAGALRLEFREASLDELGTRASPPLTKDAIAGRIRRLLAMADKEAEDRGIPNTEASVPADLDSV